MTLTDYFIPLTAFIKAFGPGTNHTPDSLSAQIETLIAQARTAALGDGIDLTVFQDALFPVAAWADEHISQSRAWPDEHAWQAFLLQRRYFKTRLAGREFFERLEQIPPSDTALREVYLLCLCLNFQGRYSLASDTSELTNIRIAQYRLLQQNDTSLARSNQELFPEAYVQGSGPHRPSRGWSRHFSWGRVLFILLPPLILFAVAFLMHTNLTHEVHLFREAIQL